MQLPETIQSTIDSLDLKSTTASEVAKDLVEHANQFAYRLMVASALLERLCADVKDIANEGKEQL